MKERGREQLRDNNTYECYYSSCFCIKLESAIVLRNLFLHARDYDEIHHLVSDLKNKAEDVIKRSNAISCSFKSNTSLSSPKAASRSKKIIVDDSSICDLYDRGFSKHLIADLFITVKKSVKKL